MVCPIGAQGGVVAAAQKKQEAADHRCCAGSGSAAVVLAVAVLTARRLLFLHAACTGACVCCWLCKGSCPCVRVCSCTVSVRPQGRTVHGEDFSVCFCFPHRHRHGDEGSSGRRGWSDRQTHFAMLCRWWLDGAESILGCAQADCRSERGLLASGRTVCGPGIQCWGWFVCLVPRKKLLLPPGGSVGGCAAHITSRATVLPTRKRRVLFRAYLLQHAGFHGSSRGYLR